MMYRIFRIANSCDICINLTLELPNISELI